MIILSGVMRISMKILKWSLINRVCLPIKKSLLCFISITIIYYTKLEKIYLQLWKWVILDMSDVLITFLSTILSRKSFITHFEQNWMVDLFGKRFSAETIPIDGVMLKILRPSFILGYVLNRNSSTIMIEIN